MESLRFVMVNLFVISYFLLLSWFCLNIKKDLSESEASLGQAKKKSFIIEKIFKSIKAVISILLVWLCFLYFSNLKDIYNHYLVAVDSKNTIDGESIFNNLSSSLGLGVISFILSVIFFFVSFVNLFRCKLSALLKMNTYFPLFVINLSVTCIYIFAALILYLGLGSGHH